MDELLEVKGSTLTVYVPEELDHHYAEPVSYTHLDVYKRQLILCGVMREHGVKNIIFSSSATVYGDPAEIPITENCPKGICTNPYGWTKWMLEQILTDIQKADPEWNVILLRYFNVSLIHISARSWFRG